jgi:NAD-dependent SIR2 family protein deacetylase
MTFEKPLSESHGDGSRVQCETCGKWFDDSELDAHLNEHLNEPASKEAEPQPPVLSEAQEARIRATIEEQTGFWSIAFVVIVVLFIRG